MSSPQARAQNTRGSGGRRGGPRGRGGNQRGGGGRQNNGPQQKVEKPEVTEVPAADVTAPEPSESGEEVCWICAEPVKYYSVSQCNHRTCHVCALRLRALYKRNDCTFCKVWAHGMLQNFRSNCCSRKRKSMSYSPPHPMLPSNRLLSKLCLTRIIN